MRHLCACIVNLRIMAWLSRASRRPESALDPKISLMAEHHGRLEAQPCQRRAIQCREGLITVFSSAAKPHQASVFPCCTALAATVYAKVRDAASSAASPHLNRRRQFIGLLRLDRLDRLPILSGGQRSGLG